jgi:hypothetical protein
VIFTPRKPGVFYTTLSYSVDNAIVSHHLPVRFDDRSLVHVSVDVIAQLCWKAEKRRLLLIGLRTSW